MWKLLGGRWGIDMPNRIRKHQMKTMKGTTEYNTPIFKSGLVQKAISSGDNDYGGVDTGVAKFPNAVLAGGVCPEWVSASWSYYLRAAREPYNGGTNIVIDVHTYSGANQTVGLRWWAIGY